MRIGFDAARRIMEADPVRWLYVLLDLDDPVRREGLSFYRTESGLAVVSDFAEETTVRLYAPDFRLLGEAASDPAVGEGTRFCFCAGLPPELRDLPDGGSFSLDGMPLVRRDGMRTIDRYGLFGLCGTSARDGMPEGFAARLFSRNESPDGSGLPDSNPWRAFASRLDDREPGDRIWLARDAATGEAAGYLWTAQTARDCDDIVNLFVSPEYRRRGIARALLSLYAKDARSRGRGAYYGYALSRESAALARSAGIRRIWGETVSFTVPPRSARPDASDEPGRNRTDKQMNKRKENAG